MVLLGFMAFTDKSPSMCVESTCGFAAHVTHVFAPMRLDVAPWALLSRALAVPFAPATSQINMEPKKGFPQELPPNTMAWGGVVCRRLKAPVPAHHVPEDEAPRSEPWSVHPLAEERS